MTAALRWIAALAACCAGACGRDPPLPPPARPKAAADFAPAPLQAVALQRVELSLPCSGAWIVGQGYHGSESHHGYAAYALDLVKVDEAGRAYAGRGRRKQDWFGFGAELLATADGEVVRAIDRFPDNRILGTSRDANTVIIRHGPSEYSEYVHLQRGSLRVRVGERVRRGQPIARAGNSGAQTPHLHWALLASIDPIRTRPARFAHYEVQDQHGGWQPASGTPRKGDVIRPRPATSLP